MESGSGAHQPHIQWVAGGPLPGVKRGRGVTLTTHCHLASRPKSKAALHLPQAPPWGVPETALFNRSIMTPALCGAQIELLSTFPDGIMIQGLVHSIKCTFHTDLHLLFEVFLDMVNFGNVQGKKFVLVCSAIFFRKNRFLY
jgi:hypothetical protein